MKQISDRRVEALLNVLLSNDNPITIDGLSNALGVSNRTVRNDLDKLQNYISNFQEDVVLMKKPRIGIWLEYNDIGLSKLNQVKEYSDIYIEPYSPSDRQNYILKKLMKAKSAISMQTIADELFVSRVTIYKDLKEVEDWLGQYGLTLEKKQNHGIEIHGDEGSWRRAASELLIGIKKEKEIKEMLSQTFESENRANSRLNHHDINHIKELIPHIEIIIIEKIISESEKRLKYQLSDEAFTGLLIHIAISIERLKQLKDIKMNAPYLQDIKQHEEYKVATWIANQLEKELQIEIPESEIGYITLHILGAKPMEPVSIGDNKDSLIKNIEPEILGLTREIIALIETILSVNFNKDHNLLVGLGLHLRTAVNRLKYGLSLRNPLLDKIKENYPSVFGACWATSILFEKHFGIRITEEEIGYIAIHIGAALERLNTKTKAIVVCSTGVGTSQLVVSRLENRIKNLEIVGVSSYHDIDKYEESDFDIIISTIPMTHKTKPVIKINVFVDEQDLRAINGYVKNFDNKVDSVDISCRDLFQQNFIFTKYECNNKETLIKQLGKQLVNANYVSKEFIDSALSRESITSTAVGKGVAIPHGKMDFVKTPTIAVAILNKSMEWKGSYVDIVFLLALRFDDGQETRKFFKQFSALCDNDEKLEELRNAKNEKELYQFLKEM